MDWQEALETLEIWAVDRGYHIEFIKGGDDCICYINKLIEINSSNSYEEQVYCLLHECGHVLIFENGSFHNFDKIRELDISKNSKLYRVYTVLEEAEAWKRGQQLAKRLFIQIDEAAWEKQMVLSLSKYINWAAD